MKSSKCLSESQTNLVKQSWPTIVTKSFWISFYENLFERSPSYQLFFDRFARVAREELRSNVHFLAHTSRTAFAFDTAIGLLQDDPKELRRVLEDLGAKHRRFHLTAEHFQIVKDLLVDMIEDRLTVEPSRRRALTEAWKQCVDSVIGVIGDSAIVDTAQHPHSDAAMKRKRN